VGANSTLECDELLSVTVSCEIVDTLQTLGVQWRMPTRPPTEHLIEIAEILALGLTRLQARKSSPKLTELGESSLHFSPDQSGGVPPCSAEASHD
jgi:hypothetical protein